MENEDNILELPETDGPATITTEVEADETASAAEPPADGQVESSELTIVGWALASKILLLVFGATSAELLTNKWIGSWRGWLEIWYRWDSMRYIRIAEVGYSNTGPDRHDLVGFPLYAWLVRGFSYIFQDYLLSGFIVALFATVAAALLIYKLTKIDDSETASRNSAWFLLIFPTAFFLHISYPESLFLALVIGSFLSARKKHWVIAVVLAFLACMTRINGIVLVGALAIEAIHQYYETRKFNWQWLLVALVPLGFGVHMLVNYSVTGDAFAFMQIGKENYHKSLAPPWNGIRGLVAVSGNSDVGYSMVTGFHELFFIAIGLVCTILSAVFLRPAYTIWIAGNLLLFTSVGFILGVPRYTLTLFPIYILFGKLGERPFWFGILTISSLLLLAQFASRFVSGAWAFG